jgi:hypothetical protein
VGTETIERALAPKDLAPFKPFVDAIADSLAY